MWLFFQRYRFFFSNPNYDFQSVHRSAYGDFWRRRPSGPCRSKQDVNWLVTERRWVCTFAVTGLGLRCHGPKLGAQRCRHAWRGMARTMGRALGAPVSGINAGERISKQTGSTSPHGSAKLLRGGRRREAFFRTIFFFSFQSFLSLLTHISQDPLGPPPTPFIFSTEGDATRGRKFVTKKNSDDQHPFDFAFLFFFLNSGMHCLPPNARKCNWLQENWSEDGAPCSALH